MGTWSGTGAGQVLWQGETPRYGAFTQRVISARKKQLVRPARTAKGQRSQSPAPRGEQPVAPAPVASAPVSAPPCPPLARGDSWASDREQFSEDERDQEQAQAAQDEAFMQGPPPTPEQADADTWLDDAPPALLEGPPGRPADRDEPAARPKKIACSPAHPRASLGDAGSDLQGPATQASSAAASGALAQAAAAQAARVTTTEPAARY